MSAFGGLTLRDVVIPDQIISASGDVTDVNPLDPCPNCNSRPHDAPEGIHSVHSAFKSGAKPGDAVWNFGHCWKCGFRPGVNQAANEAEMKRQFDFFKNWIKEEQEKLRNERGMTPPNSDEVDALKAQLAEATAREADLRAQLGTDASDTGGA